MTTTQPLVSIILPAYNASLHVADSLQSLLKQTYQNIEIIAIDDFSKDNTFSVIKAFRKKDKRLRAYKNKKRYGLATTLNRSLRRAKGDFIAFMDPHDTCSPNKIKNQITYLLTFPKVVAVGTQCAYIGNNNKRASKSAFPLDHSSIVQTLLAGLSMQFETAMINKSLLPKDILHFRLRIYPFLFVDVFMKFLSYGQIANLISPLYHRRQTLGLYVRLTKLEQFQFLTKLWIKSAAIYNHKPSLKTLFTPLLQPFQTSNS